MNIYNGSANQITAFALVITSRIRLIWIMLGVLSAMSLIQKSVFFLGQGAGKGH